ncbi:MAG TPA: hypothetical protein VK174_10715 [Chitinophagales bacterium]|nr:hypothetical protein [Chitinophagales bacterium]
MEPEKTELYIQKLKESIDINRTLLTTDSETHRDLNQFNARFQSVLQEVFEQSQATLPFFEGIGAKLNEDEHQLLIQFATKTTALHQQFFEVWKQYKDLEVQTGAQLSSAAERIKAFAQD